MDDPDSSSRPGRDLELLPTGVRRRVLALAAQVLPEVPDLPGSLRSVASFTPNRRARLGGHAIAAALAEEDFRRRVGVQATPLVAPDAPAADRAALLWMTGEDDDGLAAHLDSVLEAERAVPHRDAEVERLRAAVAAAREEGRALRAAHREEVAGLKEQNKALRRRLGEARAAERTVREQATGLQEQVAASGRRRERAAATAEAELRRVRAQLDETTAQLERLRAEERTGRGDATLRARVLLDTVLDAAAGLRRELALPAVEGSPSARVEEELEARRGARDPSDSGVLGGDSPALLDQLLGLPRARLIVDGYNVSKTAWESLSLEAQRARLLQSLGPVVARTRAETTVVFDAASAERRPLVSAPRGVKVLFSPYGVIADDVIRDLLAAEPGGRAVVVVTSDREVADDVRRAGFRCVGAPALLGLLARH